MNKWFLWRDGFIFTNNYLFLFKHFENYSRISFTLPTLKSFNREILYVLYMYTNIRAIIALPVEFGIYRFFSLFPPWVSSINFSPFGPAIWPSTANIYIYLYIYINKYPVRPTLWWISQLIIWIKQIPFLDSLFFF